MIGAPHISRKPLTAIQKSAKTIITVRLKDGVEYRGKVYSADPYMNLIMTDAEERQANRTVANYGRVIVRGNNILFIKLEDDF